MADGVGVAVRWWGGVFGLCKNCRRTIIFTILVFPHFLHSSQWAPRGHTEGASVVFDSSDAVIATNWLLTPPLQKLSTNHYFYDTSFHPLFALFAVWAPMGRAEGASVVFDSSDAVIATNWLLTPPLQKLSANHYFYDISFPPLFTFFAVGAQWPY